MLFWFALQYELSIRKQNSNNDKYPPAEFATGGELEDDTVIALVELVVLQLIKVLGLVLLLPYSH